jgi:hypothetical protein
MEKKQTEEQELPIASMMIGLYQKQVKDLEITKEKLEKINKRLGIMFLILLILFAIETTYVIACWDYLHPNAGIIHSSE